MSEKENEKKETGSEAKSSSAAKVGVKVIIGVILIALGLWAVIGWWPYLLIMIKGFVGLFLIMAGAITIAIAKE